MEEEFIAIDSLSNPTMCQPPELEQNADLGQHTDELASMGLMLIKKHNVLDKAGAMQCTWCVLTTHMVVNLVLSVLIRRSFDARQSVSL
jgi:hypothetical protein